VNFDKVWAYPKPLQQPHPPVIMGGDAPTTFDRVIEFCDGWMPIQGRPSAGPDLAEKIGILKTRVAEAGRDPASISISVFAAQPNQENVSRLGEAGVERMVFSLPAADRETVLPLIDEYAKLIG
jgi:alkanesulfonate monooxygenase SsuD/methylene tetrahydromethanopterin reductase-like flavin-dependent oxidoreductase (luciferase family)